MTSRKFAILMDGGFVTKKLVPKLGQFPSANDVQSEVDRISGHEYLAGHSLMRVYFYDASPSTETLKNPIDGTTVNLGATKIHSDYTSLHQGLELMPDFALRMGETVSHGWTFGSRALKNLTEKPRQPEAKDFVPNIEQKGVDLRIGLDIARLSLKSLVDVIVVVTGDSDLIPAFKFARREGVKIYVDVMGHGVKRDLKVHADRVIT